MSILSKEREFPIVATEVEPEIKEEPNQETYLEKVEKEVELPKSIKDHGQVILTSPSAQPVKIVLPVSQKAFANPLNWKKPINFALRWLLVFAERIRKIYPGETTFKE